MDALGLFQRILRGLSLSKSELGERVVAGLFSTPFLLGGLAVAFMGWAKPVWIYLESADWELAEGVVRSSEVRMERGSDGDNLGRIAIEYDYYFQGQRYSGDRFNLGSVSTNVAVQKMHEVVGEYPEGRGVEVYVDPDAPENSVIVRKLSPQVWVAIPFSMPFILVGVIGVGYATFINVMWKRSQELKKALAPDVPEKIGWALRNDLNPEEGKLLFTAIANYHQGLLILAAALFWNGIVAVFLVIALQFFLAGDGVAIILSLFLIPFVLIGVVLIVMTFRCLASRRPPAWVTLSGASQLGADGRDRGTVALMWAPIPEERQQFRSCKIGLVRMKSDKRFKKWKAENSGWESSLVPMKRGAEGEAVFAFEELVRTKKKLLPETYDLHLVMRWISSDCLEGEAHWQVSPQRESD